MSIGHLARNQSRSLDEHQTENKRELQPRSQIEALQFGSSDLRFFALLAIFSEAKSRIGVSNCFFFPVRRCGDDTTTTSSTLKLSPDLLQESRSKTANITSTSTLLQLKTRIYSSAELLSEMSTQLSVLQAWTRRCRKLRRHSSLTDEL
nr:hypothetical protein Iba_chr05eCG10160 [Ipomoea batatas]